MRPERRPDPAARPREAPPRDAPPQATPPGDASADARAGQADGREAARAPSAAARPAPEAGAGSAAAGYPGLVLRAVSRVPRGRVGGQGQGVAGFAVASDGALAAARMLRGSGSARLDAVAVSHVERASSFPPPGAQRRFQIVFEGPG